MEARAEEIKEQKKRNELLLVASARGLLDDLFGRPDDEPDVFLFHPLPGVKKLVDLGASISSKDKKGFTALHFAAARNRYEVAKYLWSKAADIDAESYYCRTPLHLACGAGHTEIAQFLIEKGGAFIDAQDNHDDTPLHCAARTGMVDIVKLLIQKGADTKLRNMQGFAALEEALLSGSIACATVIKASTPEVGAQREQIISLEKRYAKDYSLLHLLAGLGQSESVSWLLDHVRKRYGNGARQLLSTIVNDIQNEDRLGPLHAGALSCDFHTVELLIEVGGDPRMQDKVRRKPIDLIPSHMFEENPSVVQKLRNLLAATTKNKDTGHTEVSTDGLERLKRGEGEYQRSDIQTEFLSLSESERISKVKKLCSIALKDPKEMEQSIRGFPGSAVIHQHVVDAAQISLQLDIHRAYSALRHDIEFQKDISFPKVLSTIEEIRGNPSLYDSMIDKDPRLRSVLERIRRLHADLQSWGLRTVSLDKAISSSRTDELEDIKEKDKEIEKQLRDTYMIHIEACIAACCAPSHAAAEQSATDVHNRSLSVQAPLDGYSLSGKDFSTTTGEPSKSSFVLQQSENAEGVGLNPKTKLAATVVALVLAWLVVFLQRKWFT